MNKIEQAVSSDAAIGEMHRVTLFTILWVNFIGTLGYIFNSSAPLRISNTPLAQVTSSIVGSFLLTLPLLGLFTARALDGITGGNVSVANAYLAEVVMASCGLRFYPSFPRSRVKNTRERIRGMQVVRAAWPASLA